MKRKAAAIGIATVVAGALAACGHDGEPARVPQPPASTGVDVTTAELLANYATQPSETAAPVAVNAGAFNITDTSEVTAPISVNGT